MLPHHAGPLAWTNGARHPRLFNRYYDARHGDVSAPLTLFICDMTAPPASSMQRASRGAMPAAARPCSPRPISASRRDYHRAVRVGQKRCCCARSTHSTAATHPVARQTRSGAMRSRVTAAVLPCPPAPAQMDGTVESQLRYPYSLAIYRDGVRSRARQRSPRRPTGSPTFSTSARATSGGSEDHRAAARAAARPRRAAARRAASRSTPNRRARSRRSSAHGSTRRPTPARTVDLAIRLSRADRHDAARDAGRRDASPTRQRRPRNEPALRDLSLVDVGIAAALVAVNGTIYRSASAKLALAAVRTVVQLLAIGCDARLQGAVILTGTSCCRSPR